MIQLVDIDMVKQHLRYEPGFTAADETIAFKIDQASAIILDYLKIDETPDPVKGNIEAATLLCVEALFDGGDPLSDTIKALLHRSRDPELA